MIQPEKTNFFTLAGYEEYLVFGVPHELSEIPGVADLPVIEKFIDTFFPNNSPKHLAQFLVTEIGLSVFLVHRDHFYPFCQMDNGSLGR